ncbi:hypothetical protein NQ176_g914 [Zarea fungicola]|uniref:Uncharacterized protein n=1 Tax=Zarea fungicola TaxID=93591 RepID=A0ACC1NWA6_9HYPO|nr:hypothetical protein NQ176_g914 [Lecanicillium fungicola]
MKSTVLVLSGIISLTQAIQINIYKDDNCQEFIGSYNPDWIPLGSDDLKCYDYSLDGQNSFLVADFGDCPACHCTLYTQPGCPDNSAMHPADVGQCVKSPGGYKSTRCFQFV